MRSVAAAAAVLLAIVTGTSASGGECRIVDGDPLFISTILSEAGRAPPKRTAFVVGVGSYANLSAAAQLPNPPRDALIMTRRLQGLGFTVVEVIDGDASVVADCFDRFKTLAADTDVALFFYAGHGIQADDRNYMLTADAVVQDGGLTGIIDATEVIETMAQSATSSLVFLDACRDNPFSGAPITGIDGQVVRSLGAGGLAPVDPKSQSVASARGLFLAFATSPHATALDGDGVNSPFTAALTEALATPGYSVQRVMAAVTNAVGEATGWTQTPWTRTSLSDDVYLNGVVDAEGAATFSQARASEASERLGEGDRLGAIAAALQGVPAGLSDDRLELFGDALSALREAHRAQAVRFDASNVRVFFNPDRTRFFTVPYFGTGDGIGGVWDAESATRIASLPGADLMGVVAPTGDHFFTNANYEPVVHVWDAVTGEGRGILRPNIPPDFDLNAHPYKSAHPMTVSADGRRVAAVAAGAVHVWDVETLEVLDRWRFEGETDGLSLSPDGRHVSAVAIQDKSAAYEEAQDALHEQIRMARENGSDISALDRRLNEARLAALAPTGFEILTRDVTSGEVTTLHVDIPQEEGASRSSAPLPVASCANDWLIALPAHNRTAIVSPGTGDVRLLPGVGDAWGASFSPSCDRLALNSNSFAVHVLDVTTGELSDEPDMSKTIVVNAATGDRVWLTVDKWGDVWDEPPPDGALVDAALAELPGDIREVVEAERLRYWLAD